MRRWIPSLLLVAKLVDWGPCAWVSTTTDDVVLTRGGVSSALHAGERLYANDLLFSKRGHATLILDSGDVYDIYSDSATVVTRRSTLLLARLERLIIQAKAALQHPQTGNCAGRAVIAVRG
jgi:hypothetical protein